MFDTIEYEGALWLVTEWMKHNTEAKMRPRRIIRLTGHPFQDVRGQRPHEYLLNVPIPKSLVENPDLPPEPSVFEVVDMPPIAFELKGPTH